MCSPAEASEPRNAARDKRSGQTPLRAPRGQTSRRLTPAETVFTQAQARRVQSAKCKVQSLGPHKLNTLHFALSTLHSSATQCASPAYRAAGREVGFAGTIQQGSIQLPPLLMGAVTMSESRTTRKEAIPPVRAA